MKTMDCKYDDLLTQYGFTDIKAEFHRWIDLAKVRQVSVLMTGESGTLLKFIADFLEVPELSSIMFPNEYRLHLRYSETTSFYITRGASEEEVSFVDFSQQIQDCSGLDEASQLFEGAVSSNYPILKHMDLIAATISGGVDDEMLVDADSYLMTLSATHFLSVKERNLLRNAAIRAKAMVICDIDKIHEDEIEHVKSLLSPYEDDTTIVLSQPLTKDARAAIFSHLTEIPKMLEQRIGRIEAYLKPVLIQRFSNLLDTKEKMLEKQRNMLSQIHRATVNIAEYQEKTYRYVSVNYIDHIKTNTTSAILNFYEKMNQDITLGIEEENDLKNLQAELPNFIAGSWSEFVSNVLNGRVQNNVNEVAPAIDTYIDDKIELFLKDILTDTEYESIRAMVAKTIHEKLISSDAASQVSEQSAMRKDTVDFRTILPKFLMVFGGFVMLSSSFVPGALLLVAGIKGNRDAANEIKEDLIVAGKRLNYQYLKEVQENLDALIEQLNTAASYTVESCYQAISHILLEIVPEYENVSSELQMQISEIRRDMEIVEGN
ncbi:MAG: hypothetical protein IKC03_02195 [Oscillospiraceae bacterium]|nr:hypothetical protein [Oscillospiraceae bacterium]